MTNISLIQKFILFFDIVEFRSALCRTVDHSANSRFEHSFPKKSCPVYTSSIDHL